jgi:nitrogen fixation protein FixH
MQFPGVMYNNYQKKELKYNHYLRQLEQMQQRGWRLRKGWLGKAPTTSDAGIFQLVIEDASGRNIEGLKVGGRFMRASDSRQDILFDMKETSPGVYQVELLLPHPGLWNVNISFSQGDEAYEVHASTRKQELGERN